MVAFFSNRLLFVVVCSKLLLVTTLYFVRQFVFCSICKFAAQGLALSFEKSLFFKFCSFSAPTTLTTLVSTGQLCRWNLLISEPWKVGIECIRICVQQNTLLKFWKFKREHLKPKHATPRCWSTHKVNRIIHLNIRTVGVVMWKCLPNSGVYPLLWSLKFELYSALVRSEFATGGKGVVNCLKFRLWILLKRMCIQPNTGHHIFCFNTFLCSAGSVCALWSSPASCKL